MRLQCLIAMMFILCTSILPPVVLADGGVVPPDPDDIIQIPSQAAAIFWDGTTEKMILSSDMSAPTDISDMVWLIPIQSNTKPEVTKSDDAIFRILDELVIRRYQYELVPKTLGEEVQVIESKRINAYNITILKATDASELIKWLNANNYTIPNETQFILQDYCDRGFYFIANKIDMSDINQTTADKNLLKTPLMITFKPKEPLYPMRLSSINPGISQVDIFVFSSTPVEDKNAILKVQSMIKNPQKQSNALNLYLSDQKIDTEGMDYLTYLTYNGDLGDLTGDSVFIKKEYDPALDPYWEPLSITILVKAVYILSFIVITAIGFFGGLYVLLLVLIRFIEKIKKL